MTVRPEVFDQLRYDGGLLVAREHPRLRRTLQRMVAQGLLVVLAPGVLAPAEWAGDVDLRLRAAARAWPDGVLTGAGAARLTFWPELSVNTVTVSVPRKVAGFPGFACAEEWLPPDLVHRTADGAVTVPALTALDLVRRLGGAGIDRVLLTRAAGLAEMNAALALTPRRAGNRDRRRLLHDSRDEPWSEAERECHALLRRAGIRGWRTNLEVCCRGSRYFVDLAFPGCRVAIEVDGFAVHARPHQFQRDRRKWSDLTAAGWRTVHLTWAQVTEEPDWVVETVRQTLAVARNDGTRAA